MRCKCGTHFCKTCIEPIYESTKCCPICKGYFKSIAPNVALERLISGKRVYCYYKDDGCEWVGELRNLDAHLKDESTTIAENCQFYPVACMLCDTPIRRKSMLDHRSFHCLKRLICCDYCEYTSDYTDVTENHIPKCDFAIVKCSNGGCDAQMQRIRLSRHISVCPETIVRCELASLGCDDYFRRKELYSHYELKMPFHMSLMVMHGSKERQELEARLVYLESERKKLSNELKATSDAVGVLRKENGNLALESSHAMKNVKLLREEVTTLMKKLSKEEQKSTLLSARVDEFETTHKKQTLSIKTTNYQVDQHTDDMKYLASNATSNTKQMLDSMEVLQADTVAMRDKEVADRKSIESLEDQLEVLQDLASITLASRIGSCPVTIVLRDFSKWQVGNAEWSSPPFYLDGYKLCLSAFVNGDAVDGYLSLYVHLMMGENDSNLSWPFQHTVTLELLHPDPSQRNQNKKESLRFDSSVDAKYTRRVVTQKQAKGWGYAKFIQHSELIKFLRGRREFLMIRVS